MRPTRILVPLLLAGCVSSRPAPTPAADPAPAKSASTSALCATQPAEHWVDCVLSHLTLHDKAAQMVWPSFFGDYVAADAPAWQTIRHAITKEHVGGVLISVGSPLEIAAKLNAVQAISDLPLLTAADLEAGAGYRARGGYILPNAIKLGGAVVFPPNMALGATGDTALAYEQGTVTALEGRALGITMAFAPVLDVNNNPANPVINTRSFGENPHAVARLGAAFIRGVQEHGMLATGKHFPGHGDTGTNSHLALPVVHVSRARLDSVELVPFRAAIATGVDAIMSFHGSMPALDSSGAPGTLSKKVLTGLLRNELGFRGLVISDAMDMRAVLDMYGPVEAATRAVEAGADVLIQPLDVGQAVDAIVAGVTAGRYSEARLDRSVRRILEAKHRLGLEHQRLVNLDTARTIVGDSGHVALARRIAERSITLVKDSLRELPLGRLTRGARVLSITYAPRSDLGAGVTFNAELRRAFDALRPEYVDAGDPGTNFFRLLKAADSADVVIVSSYVAAAWNASTIAAPADFTNFVHRLVVQGHRPIVVALGNPYLLQAIPEVPAYLVAWGGFPVSQRAAARALLGAIPIGGHLPIGIPPVAPLGAGEMRPARGSGMP